MRIPIALALIIVAALPALAGCASDEEPQAPTPEADPTPAPMTRTPVERSVSTSGAYPVNPGYSPTTMSVPANSNVTIVFTNAEAGIITHNWVLEGVDGGATDIIGPGAETSITFDAPPAGEYKFFCSVGDHRARGMEGTFTVTA